MPQRILILESSPGSLAGVAELLASETPGACEVDCVTDADSLLDAETPDLLFVDAEGRADDGVGVLTQLHQAHPELPLVLVAPRGDVELARRAVDAGAIDLLVRGERLSDRVATQLRKLKRITRLRKRVDVLERDREVHAAAAAERYRIVGEAPNLRDLVDRVVRVAPVPRPVLILGERGTGKELVARALHEASGRSGPFVVVNSAALADDLLEAELFGHERGAYTGADRRVRGRFELAHQGTLFLDEIGHMSSAFQRKLLRVLEDGRFARVGGEQEVCVDTRVVAATNIDLDARMKAGAFLPDLYDRLAFEVLRLPALRQRVEDIRLLADHFLARFLREVPGYAGRHFDEDAYRLLESYDYPGNVRELRYIVERAAYRSLDDVLRPEDIGELSRRSGKPHAPGTFKQRLEAFEREMIAEAMAEAEGNQAAAARLLGLSYHQLRYYATKHK